MTTFHEVDHPRAAAGAPGGGQFAAKPGGAESSVVLDATVAVPAHSKFVALDGGVAHDYSDGVVVVDLEMALDENTDRDWVERAELGVAALIKFDQNVPTKLTDRIAEARSVLGIQESDGLLCDMSELDDVTSFVTLNGGLVAASSDDVAVFDSDDVEELTDVDVNDPEAILSALRDARACLAEATRLDVEYGIEDIEYQVELLERWASGDFS